MSSGGTHSGGGLDPSGSGSPAERGSPPETRTALPRKILVVDDDPSLLLLLQNTFKKASEVLTAPRAEAGPRVMEGALSSAYSCSSAGLGLSAARPAASALEEARSQVTKRVMAARSSWQRRMAFSARSRT
ncbi:MAG: hypothetical protein ACO4B3_07730 [Planctomycetota bacterium]